MQQLLTVFRPIGHLGLSGNEQLPDTEAAFQLSFLLLHPVYAMENWQQGADDCSDSYYYGENDCDKRTASVREKKRMCSINVAFAELRNYIPTFPFEKRLSKIDTLNLAIAYIHMLNDLLHSPIEPHRYIRKCVAMAKSGNPNAPCWSTSDLVARLSWIKWRRLGMEPVE